MFALKRLPILCSLATLAVVPAVGMSGKAREVDLLFNSRCNWSVLFVWQVGGWFGNREAESGRRAMAHRLGERA